jgi:hypothetical protein
VSPRTKRILLLASAVIAALFILVNLVLWGMYRNRTYPNTQLLGTTIGNTPYNQLSTKVQDKKLLPEAVDLSYDGKKVRVTLEELGIYKQVTRTTNSANQQRSWLPVLNLLSSPRLKAPIAIDSKTFDAKSRELAAQFYKQPANARLVLEGTTISITSEKPGYSLDQKALQERIFVELDRNVTAITPPVTTTQPDVKAGSLGKNKQEFEQKINAIVTYKYNGKTKQTTAADTARWFVASGEAYVVSNENVRTYITQVGGGFGIRVKDINQAVNASAQAVGGGKSAEVVLTAQTVAKTYTYCTAARDVDTSFLPGLRSKLQSTYSNSAGWSLGGQVEFKEVGSGCNFTVWLSAASQMPTFGAICDSSWSCRVGSNVVINFDRWQGASDAWNASGGTLEEYRNMVINHETGHWLGFGHSHCPGPGLPAPVMQQQSINLQGCAFNAWPTSGEQATLRNRLGI